MTMQIELQNYRRFVGDGNGGPVRVAFEPGLTIITGPNGAGKTTLADALHYALFGRQSNDPDPLADAAVGGGVMVACDLLIDGRPVRIERWSDRASLWVDGTLQVQEVTGSLRSVSREVKTLLGDLTADKFSQLYVAAQGQTAGLVEETAKRRRDIVEEVLQVEVLRAVTNTQAECHDRARAAVNIAGRATTDALGLGEDARRLLARFDSARVTHTRREALSHFDSAVDDALIAARMAAEKAGVAAEALSGKVERLDAEEGQARADRDAGQLRLGEFDEATKEYSRLDGVVGARRRDLVQAEAAHGVLAGQVDEARAAEPGALRHGEFMTAIKAIDEERTRLALRAERAKAVETARTTRDGLALRAEELIGADERHADLVEKHRLARLAWEALEDDPTAADAQTLAGERRALLDDQKETEAALEALEVAGETAGTCPICREALTPTAWRDLVERYRQTLTIDLPAREVAIVQAASILATTRADWQQQRRQTGDAVQELLRLTEAARNDAAEAIKVADQLRDAERLLAAATESLDELGQVDPADPSPEDLSHRREQLEAELEDVADAAKLYAFLPSLLDRLAATAEPIRVQHEAVASAEAERDAHGYDAVAHQACREQQEDLADAVLHAVEARSERARELDGLRREAEAAHLTVEKGEKAAAEMLEAAGWYVRAARLHDTLGEFVKEYVAANTRRITERATELVRQAATDGSILGLKLDERGQLTYLDSSSVPRPIARLSGGEKALVGLCLRLALAEQALLVARSGRLDFLFLDEVLSALDDERRDAMERVFATVQERRIFRHILMITHLEAVREGWLAHGLEVAKVSPKVSRVTPRSRTEVSAPALEAPDG